MIAMVYLIMGAPIIQEQVCANRRSTVTAILRSACSIF